MYCVKCGVNLGDTEKKCPLCNTAVYHPDVKQDEVPPLYPVGRRPSPQAQSRVFNVFLLILFSLAIIICHIADILRNGDHDWFGLAVGGIILGYIILALPFWFRKPNPVIIVLIDFVAVILYLMYINMVLRSNWFMSFAFPVAGSIGLIVCTVLALTYYLRRGLLYIYGGGFATLGGFMLLLEFLLDITFNIEYIGWSIYPLVILLAFGISLIYLAIDSSAREYIEQKLFF